MSAPESSAERDAQPHAIEIEAVYNGIEKPLEVEPHELIRAVLDRIIHLFKVTDQPHRLSLFRADGTKLDEGQTAHAAGLHVGSIVYLRHDVVKGG